MIAIDFGIRFMTQQVSPQPIPAALQEFIQVVLTDQMLQEQLKAAPDWESFVELAIQLGKGKGYSFTSEDLETMIVQQDQLSVELSTIDSLTEQPQIQQNAYW